MKAKHANEAKQLQDIPNIGPAIEADLLLLGVKRPSDLKNKNPFALYQKLEKLTGTHHDPCVLDTFMAIVDFMNGAPPHPWFHYTSERKKTYTLAP